MKHVRRVIILGLMLSVLMTAVLSGCGSSDSDEGKSMNVDDAEKEFSDGE